MMEKMNMKRKRQIRNINSELSSSIIEVIFSKLPFYGLPSCRIVCKEWNDVIVGSKFDPQISICSLFFALSSPKIFCVDCDPNSWKGMSSAASFNFHPKFFFGDAYYSIANFCNGLCLLIKKCSRNGRILNPMTNEYLKVPILKIDRSIDYRYGLGFSPKTNEYKIARSFMFPELSGTHIQISAFGVNRQWRTVGFLPFLYTSEFVYFKGGLYFLKSGRFFGEDDNDCVIYRLDIEDEKLSEISSPKYSERYSMIDFNGNLYLTNNYYMWRMREDFSWIKVFVLDIRRQFFYPIKVFKDEKILGLDGFYFVLYDPKSETTLIWTDQNIEDHIKFMDFFNLTLYWRAVHISSFNFKSLSNILAATA